MEELVSRITACRDESDAAWKQALELKKEYEEAERLFREQREAFGKIAEETEPIKVRGK